MRRLAASFIALFLFAAAAPAARAEFLAYHDRTAAEHQASFDDLFPDGWRLTSLSVYGDSSRRYAAVWQKRSGPAWLGFHEQSGDGYQALFDTWVPQGFVPTVLTVTGSSASSAVFAGVFEKTWKPFRARHHMARSQLDAECKQAREDGYILQTAAVYGSALSPLFAAVWVKNDGKVPWSWSVAGSASEYQAQFDAATSNLARPAFLARSAGGVHLAVWRDDRLPAWVARHGLTAAQYQSEFDTWVGKGYWPLQVQGSGSGASTRFSALFVPAEAPLARSFSATGPALIDASPFDAAMKNYLAATGVRAASLAIARRGRLILARAYTWAEPGYPATQPTSVFRIASLTKPLTSIRIMQLVEDGELSLGDLVQPILGLESPWFLPPDPRLAKVRVWHLLSHAGGWDRGVAGDPYTFEPSIADDLGLSLPIDKHDVATWMTGEPMQFDPGAKSAYSNYGFSLLGMLVEEATGVSYLASMRSSVFGALGVPTRARLGASLTRGADEVYYHGPNPDLVRSFRSAARPWVPVTRFVNSLENFDSFGGWIMAPADYVKVLSAFDSDIDNPLLAPASVAEMWKEQTALGSGVLRGWFRATLGNGVGVRWHNGGLTGTSTLAYHRDDDISVALFLAGNASLSLDGGVSGAVTSALDATSAWPRGDLFPALGIASFCEVAGTCPGSNLDVIDAETADDLGEDDGGVSAGGCATAPGASLPALLLLLGLAITLTRRCR